MNADWNRSWLVSVAASILAYGIVLLQALLLPIHAHSADGAPAENKNLVWSGTLRIDETFSVPAGTTLEIRPGTRILFSKGSSLMVKGGGLQVTGGNLFGNSAYNIRVGDFNDEDVKAPDNWWGTDDPAGTIFDASEEPEIGHVLFESFRRERISWQ